VWGRSVQRRTVILSALAVGLFVLVAIGAAIVGKAGNTEAVVIWKTTPTPAQVAAVRRACPGGPNVTLEPPDQNDLATTRRYPVRYIVTNASASQQAQLYGCLKQFTGVNVSQESPND
jgi:hypothetical protein